MIRPSSLLSLLRSERGAISPLYAVAILPLLVMAGVAFDYSRLVSMDSELQNAADQAALAAATQLDAHNGAMADAENAARNFFVNETRAGAGDRPITDLAINFYEANFDGDGNVVTTSPLDKTNSANDARAQVVEVTVLTRRVRYALTPVMGRLFSGDVNAKAKAMLDQSTCNVAPMMFCAPSAGYGADSSYVGDTLAMHLRDKNTSESELPTDAPGNFGFLDIDYNTQGMPNNRLGLNTQNGVCVGGRVESDPGNIQVESRFLNTRFERYEAAANGSKCNKTTGDFCASENVRQGYVQVQTTTINSNQSPANVQCSATPAKGNNANWEVLPESTYPLASCLTSGTCTFVGDLPTSSEWDAYMSKAHPGVSFASTQANTRYQLHQWEIDAANGTNPSRVKQVVGEPNAQGRRVVTNYCSYPEPQDTKNIYDPAGADKDRRVLTIAAADCTDLKGKGVVKIMRWLDVFLVDSARQKGSYHQFIGEIMGPGTPPGGGSGFQKFGRGKAVLVQ